MSCAARVWVHPLELGNISSKGGTDQQHAGTDSCRVLENPELFRCQVIRLPLDGSRIYFQLGDNGGQGKPVSRISVLVLTPFASYRGWMMAYYTTDGYETGRVRKRPVMRTSRSDFSGARPSWRFTNALAESVSGAVSISVGVPVLFGVRGYVQSRTLESETDGGLARRYRYFTVYIAPKSSDLYGSIGVSGTEMDVFDCLIDTH